jgi:site-specific DNA recombinase
MAEPRKDNASVRTKLRCAIYTRKSSEEGLEQEFNSLDAQREACEAYVTSQKHEGWWTLPGLYDDGAYSGGTMERPALKRILEDIRARKIDIVVVYKVDRLTRSLADFAKIVEVFDAHGVSFVSVTQAFNTTSSMGRLTLNVLLSFAQFEREVTGERIRDKIAASKKKGMWMGGLPSLGYDVRDRKLVINEGEAATVRYIYERYLVLGNVRDLQVELNEAGIVSKARRAADGSSYGAQRLSRGALYLMLKNPIYRGQIVHKGKAFPGEHRAILDETLWSEVQRHLEENRIERRNGPERKEPSLLAGLLFDAHARAMTPTHSVKKGTRYRYYISHHLIIGTDSDNSGGQRIPASNIEGLVVDRVRALLAEPSAISKAMSMGRYDASAQKRLQNAASSLSARWTSLPTASVHELLRAVVARVQVHPDRIDFEVDAARLARTILNDGGVEAAIPSTALLDGEGHLIALTIPASLKRTGKEMKFIVEGAATEAPADTSLMRLLVRAQKIAKRVYADNAPTLEAIAREEGLNPSYTTRLLRLTFLAPDIIAAITAGRQPPALTANKLMADTRLPLDWGEQRKALGFA